jgi:NADPH2:quinone reductase
MKAIQIQQPGGPEALRYVDVEPRDLREGEVRVAVKAIGVNFLDVYHRTGLYRVPTPFTPGSEAAGVVEEIGPGVLDVQVGDRVVYSALGSYAESAIVPEKRLVQLPPEIDFRTGAAAFLQGLTAHYLVNSTHRLEAGEWIIVHAAAGGVGALLVQMARSRGAHVIGTASTTKLEVVREAGADIVVDYTTDDFAVPAREATGGRGVDVVYDSVGRTTFEGNLESLRIRGLLVCFGQSSGPIPPIDVLDLSKKSLFLTRPGFAHYTTDPVELRVRASELFSAMKDGLRIRIDRELPLSEAAEAHRLLEGRQTKGKIILTP